MKKSMQVLMVHGGMTFKSEKDYLYWLKTRKVRIEQKENWKAEYLERALGKRFQIIRPRMPLQDNAKYRDWKIWFERYLSELKGDFILVGVSLGGTFLAKYLSENKLKRKAQSVFLVCPPFDNTIPTEDLVGGFKLKSNLSLIEKNARHLHLLFSKDDDVVPAAHAEKYRAKLPNVHIAIYESKNGHFQIPTFPEIVRMIKTDAES